MDDKAQMIVLEGIVFAITILLALFFLSQLSPSSTVSEKYTNTLKIQGDDALQSLYTEPIQGSHPQNYPSNKLVYFLITNNYTYFAENLSKRLPNTVMYNIWVNNGTKTVFWCNSDGGYNAQLQSMKPVTTSHYMIAMDPIYLNNDTGIFSGKYQPGKYYAYKSDLAEAFQGYEGSTYDVILEMWQMP